MVMKKSEKSFMELTRRDFLYQSGAGMAGIALFGIPNLSYGAEKKPKYGGRLRISERFASSGLDAHKNQYVIDFFHYTLMYNALAIMGPLPDAKMYPDVAKSWEISRDGREYVFPLREGVKFHHGKELDSGDVKYSIERVMNPATRSPSAFAFKWIDAVQAIDKYHVKIKLKEPFGPFLTSLTVMTCPIIPAGSEPTPTKPAPGTGPFKFKSIVPNESTELTRFDQYWEHDEKTGDRLPYLDSIYSKKITDPAVRWTALRAGDVDYTAGPPSKVVVQELKKPTPGIKMVVAPPLGGSWVHFNCTKPPFNNKKVRQAIAYAIDKKEMIEAAYWGLAVAVNNQPFVDGQWNHIPAGKDKEMDLAKAKQLLAEAGYPNGFKTEFLQYRHVTATDAVEVMMGQLRRIGIDATMKTVDRAAYWQMMIKGQYDISVLVLSIRLDPDDAFYLTLHSGQIGKNNWSRYNNPKMDELLEAGRTHWRWEDRLPIYEKVVEIIKEDVPELYLFRYKTALAHRDYMKGFDAACGTWWGYYGGGMKKAWLDK
jgi:peptide/nickel transport system substrate-binding protein